MLDKKEFKAIQQDLENFEEKREEVIKKSREIIKLSKQVIYGLHRGDNVDALVKTITKKVKELPAERFDAGIQNVAVQEYVEALTLLAVVNGENIPTRKELEVDTENYLLGLCDLTGELVRKSVNTAIKGNKEEALKMKEIVEEIYGEFLKFEFRNGELRKKSDSIKWNLNKLEQLAYDLKIKK